MRPPRCHSSSRSRANYTVNSEPIAHDGAQALQSPPFFPACQAAQNEARAETGRAELQEGRAVSNVFDEAEEGAVRAASEEGRAVSNAFDETVDDAKL